MVYLKIIHLKDQLWIVIAGLLSVLFFADPFYSPDFNFYNYLTLFLFTSIFFYSQRQVFTISLYITLLQALRRVDIY